jgi:hypothetical protein
VHRKGKYPLYRGSILVRLFLALLQNPFNSLDLALAGQGAPSHTNALNKLDAERVKDRNANKIDRLAG